MVKQVSFADSRAVDGVIPGALRVSVPIVPAGVAFWKEPLSTCIHASTMRMELDMYCQNGSFSCMEAFEANRWWNIPGNVMSDVQVASRIDC